MVLFLDISNNTLTNLQLGSCSYCISYYFGAASLMIYLYIITWEVSTRILNYLKCNRQEKYLNRQENKSISKSFRNSLSILIFWKDWENCSPTTPYLNLRFFLNMGKSTRRAEIYTHISISQFGGGRTWVRIKSRTWFLMQMCMRQRKDKSG